MDSNWCQRFYLHRMKGADPFIPDQMSAIDQVIDGFLWVPDVLLVETFKVDGFRIDLSATVVLFALAFSLWCASDYFVWLVRYGRNRIIRH